MSYSPREALEHAKHRDHAHRPSMCDGCAGIDQAFAALDRLEALEAEKARQARLLKMLEGAEWGTRNAAENRYCLFCGNDPSVNRWKDQEQHTPSCPWLLALADSPAQNSLPSREARSTDPSRTDEGGAPAGEPSAQTAGSGTRQPALSSQELGIMQHATAWPKQHRNWFVTGEDSDDWQVIQSLVARGLMRLKAGPIEGVTDMSTFAVTNQGLGVLKHLAPDAKEGP